MAVKTRDTTIDGHTVKVTQHPGRRALRLKSRLVKLLAPSIGTIIQQKVEKGKNLLDQEVDMTKIGEAVIALADKLDPDDFENLILEILVSTRVDGKEINEAAFDDLFAGEMSLMYKVVFFALQTNFGDFFVSGGIGNLLAQQAQGMTPTPPKSTV